MGDAVRVGVIGLGQRGLQHLKVLWKLQSEGKVSIAGLCDPFQENLQQEKLARFIPGFKLGETPPFQTYDELVSGADMDAIYFCIPPGRHEGEVIRAAEAGLHLFAEKPMSLFMDEAVEMEAAIRSAGVICAVGFQRRYEALAEAAHGFLADKRPVMATFVLDGTLESHSRKHTQTGGLGGPKDQVWTKNMVWSGGTVVEAGIHQTDLMRYWFGDIAWVQAAYVPRDPNDIEDAGDNPYGYTVTYGFKQGGVGNLVITRLRKVYRNSGYQNILWDHGHLCIEGKELAAYTYDGPYPPAEAPDKASLRHVIPSGTAVDTTEAIGRAFVAAVEKQDDGDLRSTFSGSMNSLSAVLAANVSHERGGERIDLEAFASSSTYADHRRKPPIEG